MSVSFDNSRDCAFIILRWEQYTSAATTPSLVVHMLKCQCIFAISTVSSMWKTMTSDVSAMRYFRLYILQKIMQRGSPITIVTSSNMICIHFTTPSLLTMFQILKIDWEFGSTYSATMTIRALLDILYTSARRIMFNLSICYIGASITHGLKISKDSFTTQPNTRRGNSFAVAVSGDPTRNLLWATSAWLHSR